MKPNPKIKEEQPVIDVEHNEVFALTLNQKLLQFQKKIGVIKKDATNPHFKNTYASLAQILSEVKPILSDLGLVLLQPIADNKVSTVIVDTDSGDSVASTIDLPTGTPQQLGSAITYYRRYCLAGLLSLEIDDDDANIASKPTAPQTPQPIKPNPAVVTPPAKEALVSGTKRFDDAIAALKIKATTVDKIMLKYSLSPADESTLRDIQDNPQSL